MYLTRICCSTCLDVLKDPVTIPCGHSYCMKCIKGFWDEEEEKKVCSCPQCRQTFTPRPVLGKNTMLADLVEELKKPGLRAAPADRCYAGPEDVACDCCTGRKRKTVKFCLVCLASYCEKHLQPHYDAPPLKRHKLVEPSKKLLENICSRHDEVMKMFCRTDQQIICYLCSVEEHKGHCTISAAAERTERQRELEVSRQNIQQRIQDREKDVKLLQQSADETVEHGKKIFTKPNREKSSNVKRRTRAQQKTEASRVKELQEKLEQEVAELRRKREKLEQEVAELRRKDAKLKQLSHTEDHVQFLHNYISLSVTDLAALLSPPEPKTRCEFLKYSCEITLDPNTANRYLLLSEGNRRVVTAAVTQRQSYSDHPHRFTYECQVLSRESLTGRRYWEVEWRGEGVYVAVAYKNISRTDCSFGCNDKSWALGCFKNSFTFSYNNIRTPVSGPRSSRVGVYLDHRAGVLAFYSVSDTMTLLHRVQTTFTLPLYAGLLLCHVLLYDSSAEVIKVN